jgi:hypothetical protein
VKKFYMVYSAKGWQLRKLRNDVVVLSDTWLPHHTVEMTLVRIAATNVGSAYLLENSQ